MSLARIFLVSLAAAFAGMMLYAFGTGAGPMSARALLSAGSRTTEPARPATPTFAAPQAAAANGKGTVSALAPNVGVRSQIAVADVAGIQGSGYRTLIDLRPDGEATDQPPSAVVAGAAGNAGMKFAYVPTPHGDIPDATVDAFAKALSEAEGPVMLYCRSGSRAARVWALAEAARSGGADQAAIEAAVVAAGHKVDDIRPRIAQRIAQRATAAPQ